MLKSHFDAVETSLVALSNVAAGAGHPVVKGMAREFFVEQFLNSHLGSQISIGTGEIICAQSAPGEKRHQYDAIVYKSEYPKINIGGNNQAYLAESVVATIEVKSTLTKQGLINAIKAARSAKALPVHKEIVSHAGYHPPGILSYVIAYSGPKKIDTVHKWIRDIQQSLNLNADPKFDTQQGRQTSVNEGIDGAFVLNTGSVYYDNTPISLVSDEVRKQYPRSKWTLLRESEGNLLLFFLLLMQAVSGVSAEIPDLTSYVSSHNFSVGFHD